MPSKAGVSEFSLCSFHYIELCSYSFWLILNAEMVLIYCRLFNHGIDKMFMIHVKLINGTLEVPLHCLGLV